VGEQNLTFL